MTLRGRFDASFAVLAADASLGAVAVRAEAFPSPDEGMRAYVDWQNALVSPADHARAMFIESPVCHPATLLRREALDAAGGYADPPWVEDWDLWLRMHERGFRLAKVPELLFRWRRHPLAVTLRDPRCTRERFLAARATFLARELERRARPFGVWGAGKEGRRLARALADHGAKAVFFVDIDPRKIGRKAYGVPILSPADALRRREQEDAVLVVAVGARGARSIVERRLLEAGLDDTRFVLAV